MRMPAKALVLIWPAARRKQIAPETDADVQKFLPATAHRNHARREPGIGAQEFSFDRFRGGGRGACFGKARRDADALIEIACQAEILLRLELGASAVGEYS